MPRSTLASGATIAASVLFALFVGAAWEWSLDRGDEADYRERLRIEFTGGARELAADREARQAILRGSERLIAAREVGLPPTADSLRALSAALIDFRYFTPTHPALDELIASGKLDLLRSSTLRSALVTYLQERERLEVVEERERTFVADALEPYLADAIRLGPPPTPMDDRFWGPAVDRDDLERAVRDGRFRTLMTLRVDRTRTALRFSGGLGRAIERVLAELEAD